MLGISGILYLHIYDANVQTGILRAVYLRNGDCVSPNIKINNILHASHTQFSERCSCFHNNKKNHGSMFHYL